MFRSFKFIIRDSFIHFLVELLKQLNEEVCWLGVNSQPVHDTASNTEWQLLEAVFIQFVSPDDEHDMLETCRKL